MKKFCLFGWLLVFLSSSLFAADYPQPSESDYVIHDFHFGSGEVLPELRIHYRTLGTPLRDEKGIVCNAVLILHGTTGHGSNFLRPEFAGELFGKGQLLDATRYYIILPDGIGHGKSSRPSDGLHAKFPKWLPRYDRSAIRAPDGRIEGQSFTTGDGDFDGRNAHLALG